MLDCKSLNPKSSKNSEGAGGPWLGNKPFQLKFVWLATLIKISSKYILDVGSKGSTWWGGGLFGVSDSSNLFVKGGVV